MHMQPLLQQFKTYLQQGYEPADVTNVTRFVTLKKKSGPNSIRPERLRISGSDLNFSSIKNYISDINHFLNFVSASIQEPEVKPAHITPAVIKAYQEFLFHSSNPAAPASRPDSPTSFCSPATANRRLSSLRCFGRFLVNTKTCETDPTQNLTNPAFNPTLAQIITRYQKFLKLENLSKSTIKNYLSDLKKYLLWARNNIKTTDEVINNRPLI